MKKPCDRCALPMALLATREHAPSATVGMANPSEGLPQSVSQWFSDGRTWHLAGTSYISE